MPGSFSSSSSSERRDQIAPPPPPPLAGEPAAARASSASASVSDGFALLDEPSPTTRSSTASSAARRAASRARASATCSGASRAHAYKPAAASTTALSASALPSCARHVPSGSAGLQSPLVALACVRTMYAMTNVTAVYRSGTKRRARASGRAARTMPNSVATKTSAPMTPESTGETTQLRTMRPTPASTDQSTQSPPTPAIVMPTMPPTMACVVETGIFENVATSRKHDAPTSAPTMPTAYTLMRPSQ